MAARREQGHGCGLETSDPRRRRKVYGTWWRIQSKKISVVRFTSGNSNSAHVDWRGCYLFMLLLSCHEWQVRHPSPSLSRIIPDLDPPISPHTSKGGKCDNVGLNRRQFLPNILKVSDGGRTMRLLCGVSHSGNTKYPIASLKGLLFHLSKEWLFPFYSSRKLALPVRYPMQFSSSLQMPSRRRNKARKPARCHSRRTRWEGIVKTFICKTYALQPGVRLHLQNMAADLSSSRGWTIEL